MKKILILVVVVLLGCKGKNHETKPTKHDRYFMVAYYGRKEDQETTGNFFSSGDFISNDECKKYAYDINKCTLTKLEVNDYVITGFFEFKDSTEYVYFKGSLTMPLNHYCDSVSNGRWYRFLDTTFKNSHQ